MKEKQTKKESGIEEYKEKGVERDRMREREINIGRNFF